MKLSKFFLLASNGGKKTSINRDGCYSLKNPRAEDRGKPYFVAKIKGGSTVNQPIEEIVKLSNRYSCYIRDNEGDLGVHNCTGNEKIVFDDQE